MQKSPYGIKTAGVYGIFQVNSLASTWSYVKQSGPKTLKSPRASARRSTRNLLTREKNTPRNPKL